MKLLSLCIAAHALAYNSEICPVVLIIGAEGMPVRINQSDYDADPDAWELYADDTPAAAPEAAADVPTGVSAPTVPVPMVVTKEGRGTTAKFFVTDTDKNKIVGVAGIDEAGYDDEGAAWAAIMAGTAAA